MMRLFAVCLFLLFSADALSADAKSDQYDYRDARGVRHWCHKTHCRHAVHRRYHYRPPRSFKELVSRVRVIKDPPGIKWVTLPDEPPAAPPPPAPDLSNYVDPEFGRLIVSPVQRAREIDR